MILRVDFIALVGDAADIVSNAVRVGIGSRKQAVEARIHRAERVAHVEPFDRRIIGDDRKGGVLVFGIGADAVVIELLVVDALSAAICDVGTMLERLGPQRNVLIVRSVADVCNPSAEAVENTSTIGTNGVRVCREASGGDQISWRRGVVLEPLRWPAPRVVVLVPKTLQDFSLKEDLQLAAFQRDEGQSRISGITVLELESGVSDAFVPCAGQTQRGFVGEHMIVVESDPLAADAVIVAAVGVGQGRRDGAERWLFRDVVDHAAGKRVAEENCGRTFDDFDAVNIIEVVGVVSKEAVAETRVDRKTTKGHIAGRGEARSRLEQSHATVTSGGALVAEDVLDVFEIRILDEILGDHRNVEGNFLNFGADLCRSG